MVAHKTAFETREVERLVTMDKMPKRLYAYNQIYHLAT